MATSGSVRAEARRQGILDDVTSTGAISLSEAAARFDVSIMTVRRDLDVLEAEGLLRRVRGGGVAPRGPAPFVDRRQVRSRAKQSIAAKALALVPHSGAIALDASTTAGSLGELVAGQEGLTIATNAWDNFEIIRRAGGATPILTGGQRDDATGSFVGPVANQAASSMVYRRFFASATALDAVHGSTEVSLSEAEVKRAFASRAQEIVLCVDSSKIDQAAVAVGFALADLSVIITELDPADPRLDAYRDHVALL